MWWFKIYFWIDSDRLTEVELRAQSFDVCVLGARQSSQVSANVSANETMCVCVSYARICFRQWSYTSAPKTQIFSRLFIQPTKWSFHTHTRTFFRMVFELVAPNSLTHFPFHIFFPNRCFYLSLRSHRNVLEHMTTFKSSRFVCFFLSSFMCSTVHIFIARTQIKTMHISLYWIH